MANLQYGYFRVVVAANEKATSDNELSWMVSAAERWQRGLQRWSLLRYVVRRTLVLSTAQVIVSTCLAAGGCCPSPRTCIISQQCCWWQYRRCYAMRWSNSFTGTLSRKFGIKWSLKIPSGHHTNHSATLPCEINWSINLGAVVVEICLIRLTRLIACTTACCYRTTRDNISGSETLNISFPCMRKIMTTNANWNLQHKLWSHEEETVDRSRWQKGLS